MVMVIDSVDTRHEVVVVDELVVDSRARTEVNKKILKAADANNVG